MHFFKSTHNCEPHLIDVFNTGYTNSCFGNNREEPLGDEKPRDQVWRKAFDLNYGNAVIQVEESREVFKRRFTEHFDLLNSFHILRSVRGYWNVDLDIGPLCTDQSHCFILDLDKEADSCCNSCEFRS